MDGVKTLEYLSRDQVVFVLPLSPVVSNITYPEDGYTIKDLFNISSRVTEDNFKGRYLILIDLLEKKGLSKSEKDKILK